MNTARNVLIYKNQMLPYSQTFVKAQAEALTRHKAYYMGLRRVPGLSLPDDRCYHVSDGTARGRIREWLVLQTGFMQRELRAVQNIDPILIHAHFGRDAAAALPLAQRLHVPLIATFHGFDATVREAAPSTYQTIFARRKVQLQKTAFCFIAVSQFIRKQLLHQGFPEHKVRVHYIGIDTELFANQRPSERQPIVLFVGRLVEKKGCSYLIHAMAEIQRKRPDVKCVIIGDGHLRTALEKEAETLLRNYQFLGQQSPGTVKEWMQRSKVFCVPSVTAQSGDAEGFGLVFTEAQAMGLPVVSFASGGIPEAVAHEETGLLAPEKNCDRLTQYLQELLTNPQLWQQMSWNGPQWVNRYFNLHDQIRKLEDIYQAASSDSSIYRVGTKQQLLR